MNLFMTSIFPWIMSAIALTGTIINAKANKWGFIMWIVSNLYMTIVNFKCGLYAIGTLFFIYFLLAIYGFYNWSKKEKGEDKEEEKIIKTFALYDENHDEIICQNCTSIANKNQYCSNCGAKFLNYKNKKQNVIPIINK